MPLNDPTIKQITDPVMDIICSVNNRANEVIKLNKGMYQIGHWNPEFVVSEKLIAPWEVELRLTDKNGGGFCEYGVCDYPDQVLEQINLDDYPQNIVIFYVNVKRKDQSADGGWRFHKWGSYIGTHEIKYEYLYDQKDIDAVFTYHIYQF